MTVEVLCGDALDVLGMLPDGSAHCCVTSPPYFGLRDYGVEGQIGLEETPDAYVAKLVDVFREVRRVLRDDGTLWLNLGDSYAANGSSGLNTSTPSASFHGGNKDAHSRMKKSVPPGLKIKDLIGIPWLVAFALRADGWYLRSDIIWHKPNPMPESVRDRPTKSHEYVFMLSKNQKYFFDADAVAEPCSENSHGGPNVKPGEKNLSLGKEGKLGKWTAEDKAKGRNTRSVWTIATKPFSGAHFAVMTPELAERCIKAGCPVGGTVLDPFGGAGTTGVVADSLGRNATLIELNPANADMARRRVAAEVAVGSGGKRKDVTEFMDLLA